MHPIGFESSLTSTSVDASRYTVIKVKKGGELIDCIEREGLTYKPGCAFFEFVNKTEDIHERKRVILMDKVSKFNYNSIYLEQWMNFYAM